MRTPYNGSASMRMHASVGILVVVVAAGLVATASANSDNPFFGTVPHQDNFMPARTSIALQVDLLPGSARTLRCTSTFS